MPVGFGSLHVDQIHYDGIGQVWKRTDTQSRDSYYYHTGSALAQELDGSYNVEVDYMAGLRRYMPDEAEEDQYRYYARDHQGSVVQMTGHGTEPEEYTYDAWGEYADTDSLPSAANNIRYAGARLECFVDPDNSKDAIYETGARHYWPSQGRFMQRDPLSYNKMPGPSVALGVNPYIYADNNPVMKKDLSGLQAKYWRGARMGDQETWLGTGRPLDFDMYDCCSGDKYSPVSDDQLDNQILWHSVVGTQTLGWWKEFSGQTDKGLCELDPSQAQPSHGCVAVTMMTPDLACTFLANCRGAKCPEAPPPFRHPGCLTGMAPIDLGFDGNPLQGWHSAIDSMSRHLQNLSKRISNFGTSVWNSIRNWISNAWNIISYIVTTWNDPSFDVNFWGLWNDWNWPWAKFWTNMFGATAWTCAGGFGFLLLFTPIPWAASGGYLVGVPTFGDAVVMTGVGIALGLYYLVYFAAIFLSRFAVFLGRTGLEKYVEPHVCPEEPNESETCGTYSIPIS